MFIERDLYRYYYFLNIYIIYWNRSFILMKFLFFDFKITKILWLFFPFLYMVLKFFIIFSIHNFSLFSLKSTFWSKFIILHLFLYKLPKIYKLLLFSHYIYTFVLNKLLFFILWEIFFNVHDHIASFFLFLH